MKIGELAQHTAVPTKTIRYWEGEGLLPEPARTASGYRNYDNAAIDRVAFIRQSQTAGLTLAQIKQILDVVDQGWPPCEHVTAAIGDRLAEVNARIRELEGTRRQLRALGARAQVQDPGVCTGYCWIIEGS